MPWGEKGRDLDRSLHSGLEPLGREKKEVNVGDTGTLGR